MRTRDAALHLLLALLVSAPLALHPWTRLVGSPMVDTWNHAWGPWWWWHSLSHGALPWRTTLLHWPEGGVLWFIDPITAGVGAPLVPLLGPAAAFNAAVLASLVFTSWAGRRFARALGASDAASWVGAVTLTASAWITCALHNGITESLHLGFVALALAWTEDAARSRSPRAWARAGVGVGLATLASPYLGLGAAIAALIRGLPHIRRAWVGGLTATALAAPPVLLLRAQLTSPDAIIKHPDTMNLQLALHNAVDPRVFIVPLGFRSVDLSAEGFEHSMYLGLGALLLAALGAWSHRRAALPWALAALTSLILALGPFLYWGDGWVLNGDGLRLRMPWWLLQTLAPGLAMAHPLRLATPALVIVAALAALGATRLRPRHLAWMLPLLLIDGLVFSGAPWPLDTADARTPEVLLDLGDQPESNGILDLPTDAGATMSTSRYLFWQTTHHHPIPYAPDARASTAGLHLLPAFRAIAAICRRRPDEQRALGLDRLGPGDRDPASLADHGVRWIVLHRDIDPAVNDDLLGWLERSLGPGEEVGGDVRWELGGQ